MGGRGRRRVPRGPGEWGRLLYEPEWAREKRFYHTSLSEVVQSVAFLLMGVAIMLLPLFIPAPPGHVTWFMDLGLGGLMVTMGLVAYASAHRSMPFRVYATGFTLTKVGWRNGWGGREELVTWDRLRLVEVREKNVNGSNRSRSLLLRYEDGRGNEGEQEVNGPDLEDPLDAMRALREAVPDKLDRSLDPYVGEGSEDWTLTKARDPGSAWLSRHGLMVLFFIAMAFVFSVMMGLVLSREGGLEAIHVYNIVLVGGLVTFVLLFTAISSREIYLRDMAETARLRGDVIVFRRPIGFSLLMWIRAGVPLGEIRVAQRFLEPNTFGHETHLTTIQGEELRAPIEMFYELVDRSSFTRDGDVLTNRRPLSEGGHKVAETAWSKVAIAFMSCVCLALIVVYLNSTLSFNMDLLGAGLEVCAAVFLALVFTALFPWLLIAEFRQKRHRRMARDMEVDERALRIPNAPESLRVVRREEVVFARTYVRWLFAGGVEVETTRGTLDLPLTMGGRMLREGYDVEDERGLLQRAVDLERR